MQAYIYSHHFRSGYLAVSDKHNSTAAVAECWRLPMPRNQCRPPFLTCIEEVSNTGC